MKIRGWHIEGFGVHRDWRVDELPGGLEVFYGPNEAGKSTLLAFLRGVLFGYPDGRSSEPKYVPKDGVAHGGSIVLTGAAGEIVVERFTGRGKTPSIRLEDGRPGSEAELSQRLGRADAKFFRSVFAFGLRELQELGALADAGIQDHLFAAGVTGSGRPAREAARELRDAARALFDGPKGRKKTDRARLLISEISELNAELYARQELAETYPALRDRLDSLDAALRELDAKSERERQIERRARKLVELWNEVWCPLAEAREQAAKLASAVPASLPANARERLEESLARVQRDEEHLELVRHERLALARQLEELRLDEAAFAVGARVDALQARLALDESHRARLALLEAEHDASEQRVRSALARLFAGAQPAVPGGAGDPGEEMLLAVESTPQRREELRSWKAREDELLSGVREAEAAQRLLAAQLEAARGRAAEIQGRVSASGDRVPAREQAEQRLAAVSALRLLAPRLREAEADLATRESSRAALVAAHEATSRAPGGLAAGALMALGGAAAAAGYVCMARLEPIAQALAATARARGLESLAADAAHPLALVARAVELAPAGFGVLTLGLAVTAALLVASGAWLGLRRVRERRADRERSAAGQREQEAALEAARRLEAVRAEAAPQLATLALDRFDEAALAAAAARAAEERARVEANARLRDELREAEAQVEQLASQHRAQDESVAVARAALDESRCEFAAWKASVRVPVALGVDAAIEFFDEVRRGREALDERDRLQADRVRLVAERAAFRAEVDAVLEAAAAPGAFTPPADDEARLVALEQLRARCSADRAAREGRLSLERRGVDLRTRFGECESALARSRGAVNALLAEAEVDDVASLKRSLEIAAESEALERRIATGEAELERRLAGVHEAERVFLREELARGAVSAWEEQAVEAKARAAAVAEERDVVLREHQDRTRDRLRLEQSTDVMELELRKGELAQELRDVLDDWRRLRVSAHLLEEAVRRFEEVHQPGVLQEASTLFARVTGGRYPRIVQTEGREGFAVLTADGLHRSPAELSQGTTEQLYLCIRLGLVAELARAERGLPVVMDDVLVNFDDERAAAMADVLGAFAADHQVLFFTCSSRTRDLLAAAPNAALRQIGSAA